MAIYPIDHVTDTLIHVARERRVSDVTNLKLQKLLYYSQAWNLVFKNEPLFSEDIEAWVHGPVVPRVFRRFKALGWKTIESPVVSYGDTHLVAHLRAIIDAYGHFGATQLERTTHSETPWKNARGGVPDDQPSNVVITHRDMKSYFRALANGGC
ncbi:MAG TPA: type II toxin-antitoxin system antitoxin SocA domain-containing protein [Terracidiphilus sp.]|jgi:uncharacterized phage-associated protein|nr:type II toxin-antitoxin system antitoxin SocA domain-containing protein [Terracidiphilus sp.]